MFGTCLFELHLFSFVCFGCWRKCVCWILLVSMLKIKNMWNFSSKEVLVTVSLVWRAELKRKMVNPYFALCSVCEQYIDEQDGHIYRPVCLLCSLYIRNKYFHFECIELVYDSRVFELRPPLDSIRCDHCNGTVLGFDYRWNWLCQ